MQFTVFSCIVFYLLLLWKISGVKKILIIRFSSIGDIVLTTPVIRCIKKQIPDVTIHYLTKAKFKSVLDQNPYIDKLITIEKDVDEVMAELKNESYQFIVDLHNNLRSWRTVFSLHRPSKSFNKLNLRKWLRVNIGLDCLPALHIVDRYMAAAKPLGINYDGGGLDFFLDPAVKDTLLTLPDSFQKEYLAIVTGGQHKTKIYPPEQLIEFCKLYGRPVVLLGGPDDVVAGEHITSACGSFVYNGCGKYSLMESSWLLKSAKQVITNDTGLMHIAAALDKDIVSIWGNTIPEFGMTPYFPEWSRSSNQILEVKGLKCRPCSKIGFKECPKGHFKCMRGITPQALLSKVK
jgi:ADP-heptose:LPS heptosyltransferase